MPVEQFIKEAEETVGAMLEGGCWRQEGEAGEIPVMATWTA